MRVPGRNLEFCDTERLGTRSGNGHFADCLSQPVLLLYGNLRVAKNNPEFLQPGLVLRWQDGSSVSLPVAVGESHCSSSGTGSCCGVLEEMEGQILGVSDVGGSSWAQGRLLLALLTLWSR